MAAPQHPFDAIKIHDACHARDDDHQPERYAEERSFHMAQLSQ
jgi:hypothetical protein